MSIGPIIRSTFRNPAGAALIALQVALTLAIIANAIFMIDARINKMGRETGAVNEELLVAQIFYFGDSIDKKVQADIDLRFLADKPGVKSVAYSSAVPLGNSNNSTTVCYSIDDESEENCPGGVSIFQSDKLVETMGLTLIQGRDFTPEEIFDSESLNDIKSSAVLISKAVADLFFPNGDAVGKSLGMWGRPITVVGVVETLLRPNNGATGEFAGFSLILPAKRTSGFLLIRASSDAIEGIRAGLEADMMRLNDKRVLLNHCTMAETAARAYRDDQAMIYLLLTVVGLLVSVTALGIAGLVSFSVANRKKQIGTRRALGALKRDILSYFLLENALVVGVAVVVGSGLAFLLNQFLMRNYQLPEIGMTYIAVSMGLLVAISQLATLIPAWRAAKVSPAIATRTV